MARSQVDLANTALGFLVRDTIRDLDGTTPGAIHTKANMQLAIELVIGEFDWPDCRVISSLSEVELADLRGWTHAYTVPSDMVKVWQIGASKNSTPVQFEQGMSSDLSSNRSYIFTDQASAVIRYGSSRVTIDRFSAAIFELIALKLASLCCMVITKDKTLLKFISDTYKTKLSEVKTSVANAEPEMIDQEFVPEFISVRSE